MPKDSDSESEPLAKRQKTYRDSCLRLAFVFIRASIEPPKMLYPMFRHNTNSSQTNTPGPALAPVPNINPAEPTNSLTAPPETVDSLHDAGTADTLAGLDDESEQSAEETPVPDGVVAAYLDNVKKDVASQLSLHNTPECYHHSTFWIQPPDNFFIVRTSGGTIAHGLTPHALEQILRELHLCRRDLAERDYLHPLKSLDNLPSPLVPFSPFSDKNGYAGFSPSRWYINKMYMEYMHHIKPYQDQAMAAIPLMVASMDQSFKALKYIAHLDGVRAFGSLWTLQNEVEQICKMILTRTKHLHHVEGPLRDIAKSLYQHGHLPTSLLWTDNVKADRKFVEQVIPTLRPDMSAATASTTEKFPLLQIPRLNYAHAATPWLIDKACATILASIQDVPLHKKVFVGFALEWDWRASQNGHFPTSLMQIMIDDSVHLLQTYCLSNPSSVPVLLKAILYSDQLVKVGHHVQGNLDMLALLWDLEPPSSSSDGKLGWVDIGILAHSKHLITNPSLPLVQISEQVLGKTLVYRDNLRCTKWCQTSLSSEQISYATENAWVPVHILHTILDHPPAGARLSRVGHPGENITLQNGTSAVAHAIFVEQMTKFPISEEELSKGYVKLSGTWRALIRVTNVLAPNFISHYHRRTLGEFGVTPFEMVVDLASLVSGVELQRNSTSNAPLLEGNLEEEEEDGRTGALEDEDSSDSESNSATSIERRNRLRGIHGP
ncbi:hypothetical protein C8F01DRAFT_1343421 [Mycena amicta]|nr:hypothetical protein C8F01DRAFT_1343421 [Mycena amicta]